MKLTKLWQEFKAFAFKGNMIDLAVAVVIGAAFSGVINSLVKDIIMPTVIYVTAAAKTTMNTAVDVTKEAAVKVGVASSQPSTQASTEPGAPPTPAVAAAPPPTPTPTAAAPTPDPTKAVQLDWKIGDINIGNFIGELLNFMIVAFAVFLVMVKLLGSVMKKVGGTPAPSEPTTKECPLCLSVIPLRAKRCAHCTADLPAV